MIVASPKQDVANQEVSVAGPKQAVARTNHIVAPEDEVVVAWRRMLTRKSRNDEEENEVAVGNKYFAAAVHSRATQITGVVARNGLVTSPFKPLG